MKMRLETGLLALISLLLPLCSQSQTMLIVKHIEIKSHLFYPSEVVVPEKTPIQLFITNQDDTPEEFDSFILNREKLIFPQQTAIIYLPNLAVGQYDFMGEYHPHTAKGRIKVVSMSAYQALQQQEVLHVEQ